MPADEDYSPLDLDDEFSKVTAELRVLAAVLDSRSLDIDRRQASDLIVLLCRQIDRLDELRRVINPKISKNENDPKTEVTGG